MEWIAFWSAIVAVALASDSEAKAARLAKRIADLEDLVRKDRGGAKAGGGADVD